MAQKMKDSGIEWIGEIPEGWEIRKIKNNFMIYAGATPKSEKAEYWDGGIPWITPADFKTTDKYVSYGRKSLTALGYDSCGTTLVPAGSIIFSKRAPVGSVVIAKNTLCTNQGCLACIPNDAVNSTYFYYCMSIFTEQFELVSAGTTFKEIAASTFASFLLPCPPLSQQNEIVNFLDKESSRIDSMLSKTRSSIEEYKKLKQAVIAQAVTKGLRGNRETKDSKIEWLGQIPKEWKCQKLKYTIFPQNRPVFSTDEIITCFRDGIVTLRKNRREDGFTVSFTEHGYQGVEIGDLVIHGMDAFAGAIGCSDSRGKTTPVVHVCTTIGNNRFFMFFLRYMAYSNIFMDFSNGIRIRSSDFRNFTKLGIFDVLVPPIAEQNEIADYLDAKCTEIDKLIAKKEQLVKELESYKKSLIYEVVTGKREV